MRRETVVFNGRAYHRYPGSKHQQLRDYYRSHVSRTKTLFLHQEVWKFHSKRAIPRGHHVHHKDEDTGNNAPENLECLPYSDHMRIHHAGRCSPAKAANLKKVRPLGWAWHKTKTGRAYHRKRARAWMDRQPLVELTCTVCGSVRKVKKIGKAGGLYCSPACRLKARADHVPATCEQCGREYLVYKYKPNPRFCSLKCSGAARRGKA